MKRLVLLRHGESTWNREKRFTGWTDVPLNDKGIQEAIKAARLLRDEGYVFDVAFTSVLARAIKTLWLVLEEMDLMWIPVHRSWRLNGRHLEVARAEQSRNRREAWYGTGQAVAEGLRHSTARPRRR